MVRATHYMARKLTAYSTHLSYWTTPLVYNVLSISKYPST